jgi:hypothetical protein
VQPILRSGLRALAPVLQIAMKAAIRSRSGGGEPSNSKFEGLLRPMVDAARTTDVLNPEHRAARLIHPTKLQVL